MKKGIARSFGALMEVELPLFKLDPSIKTDGGKAYVFPFLSDLQLAIWSLTFSSGRRFKIEVSWSRGPVRPCFSAPPIPPKPLAPEIGVHLLSIVDPRAASLSWYFGDPLQADQSDLVYPSPEAAARDVMSKVKQIGLPFLREIVARERAGKVEDWDRAIAGLPVA